MKLDLLSSLYVFMLAAFIGFEVIRRVSPLLHTPLMSLTNALARLQWWAQSSWRENTKRRWRRFWERLRSFPQPAT